MEEGSSGVVKAADAAQGVANSSVTPEPSISGDPLPMFLRLAPLRAHDILLRALV